MPETSSRILRLRKLLAERHGEMKPTVSATFPTGLPALDGIGLPSAALSEIVSESRSGPRVSLLLYALLRASLQKGGRVVLIDGKDTFSPQGLCQVELDGLLWLRCREAWEVMKAADLAVRDGNVPLIILLLTLNPLSELRRIPATAWHRLQMLAEKSGVTLLAFTPISLIGCARLRLGVGGSFPLEGLSHNRKELLGKLEYSVERRVRGRSENEELCRSFCA